MSEKDDPADLNAMDFSSEYQDCEVSRPLKRKLLEVDDTFTNAAFEERDEALIPAVDSGLKCSGCSRVVSEDCLLTCCDCNKKFHAHCNQLFPFRKRGVRIAPSEADIASFYNIMKLNHVYLGGQFHWSCNCCVDMKKSIDNEFTAKKLTFLESALMQQKPLIEKLIESTDNWNISKPLVDHPAQDSAIDTGENRYKNALLRGDLSEDSGCSHNSTADQTA